MRTCSTPRPGSLPVAFLSLLLLALALAPSARAEDPQPVSEERVRAAFAEARAALEAECGAKIDPSLALRFVTAAEIGQRIAEENLPLVRLRQPDEEKAKLEARSLGEAMGAMMFAKFSWAPREFLVALKTLETSASQLSAPELSSDAALRAILVHELVHAWDDSRHDFAALVSHSDSIDASCAISAVIEGHAQFVTRRVCQARGWSTGFENFTGVIGKIPDSCKLLGEGVLLTLRLQAASLDFTYREGERFVAALHAAGGAESVERAFRSPPRDGETVLHPDWFLDPAKRPAQLYDPEPALDLFVARFPASVWSSQRQNIQSNQLQVGFALLPKEEAQALCSSIRSARSVALYPTANPSEKIVVTTVMEFGSDVEARAFLEASDRLSKLKDEQMKTGIVRITGSSTSTIQAEGASGLLHTKQMKNRALAFEVNSIDLVRGKVLVETLFSGEPISTADHAQLAVNLLAAVKLREAK